MTGDCCLTTVFCSYKCTEMLLMCPHIPEKVCSCTPDYSNPMTELLFDFLFNSKSDSNNRNQAKLPAERHFPAFPTAPLGVLYAKLDRADGRSNRGKHGRTCWLQRLLHSSQGATEPGTSGEAQRT